MNRREFLPIVGAGAALGLVAGITAAPSACAAPSNVSPALAAAIEAHSASIRHDETLYGDDCNPIVDAATLEASDAAIAAAFLALMAVPCLTTADASAKAAYVLGGSVQLRTLGGTEEFLNLLIPDNAWMFDPAGPLVTLLRSLAPHA